MLVVGTLTMEEGVGLDDPQFLGLPDLFLHHHFVPLLDCNAALSFLNASNIHKYTTPSLLLGTSALLRLEFPR